MQIQELSGVQLSAVPFQSSHFKHHIEGHITTFQIKAIAKRVAMTNLFQTVTYHSILNDEK